MGLHDERGIPIEALQKKKALDKDLKQIVRIESAAHETSRGIVSLGFGVLFLVAVCMFAMLQVGTGGPSIFIIHDADIGGYMELHIGANDVGTNVRPATGPQPLTPTGAQIGTARVR